MRMTGGQALVKSLYAEGVRVVFGLPGLQLYHAMDALYDHQEIRFITTRHEQGAGYMADGYTRTGAGTGTALVVPGPGLLNASAAVGTAYSSSSPMLIISGQVERDEIGLESGALHQINDQFDAIGTVTKWSGRALFAKDIPGIVHEAFCQLSSGRPLPVEIEIPPEALSEEEDITLIDRRIVPPKTASIEQIKLAAVRLAKSKNPILMVGGGAIQSEASESVVKMAEFLQAPVITTGGGKGIISDKHPLSLGVPHWRKDPLDAALRSTDLVLAIGTKQKAIDGKQNAWTVVNNSAYIVNINVDPDLIASFSNNGMGLEGDAKLTLDNLYSELSNISKQTVSRTTEYQAIKTKRFDPSKYVQPQGSYVQAIRSAMPDDGVVVQGVTQVGYYSEIFFPVYEPRTYVTSSYFGNLGYAYPTALGVKVGYPDRSVVAISGDGGFLYNSQELATAVKYGINVVVIVFNDNAYGNVKREQLTLFNGRNIGVNLHNPDFVKLAESYGALGFRANGPEELEKTLDKALSINAPSLIEVPVEMMPDIFYD